MIAREPTTSPGCRLRTASAVTAFKDICNVGRLALSRPDREHAGGARETDAALGGEQPT